MSKIQFTHKFHKIYAAMSKDSYKQIQFSKFCPGDDT